ncbi:hypothetical protein BGZ76_011741 [Entomortierella beljakovae]|nr:hypothetical protein BGZ76_011741 [Entomortierella beljakovae]
MIELQDFAADFSIEALTVANTPQTTFRRQIALNGITMYMNWVPVPEYVGQLTDHMLDYVGDVVLHYAGIVDDTPNFGEIAFSLHETINGVACYLGRVPVYFPNPADGPPQKLPTATNTANVTASKTQIKVVPTIQMVDVSKDIKLMSLLLENSNRKFTNNVTEPFQNRNSSDSEPSFATAAIGTCVNYPKDMYRCTSSETMLSGTRFKSGSYLDSNKGTRFFVQSNGVLCLWHYPNGNPTMYWCMNPSITIQNDFFVTLSKNGRLCVVSGTQSSCTLNQGGAYDFRYRMMMPNDGNLVIYRGVIEGAIWASNTVISTATGPNPCKNPYLSH